MKIPPILNGLTSRKLADPMQLWEQAHLSRRAGVLVVLSPASENDVNVLLTTRSQQLSYAGDAAFPGGKADFASESPWDTAIREAHEEVGINPSDVQHISTLPGYVSSKLLLVVPSVAWSPVSLVKPHTPTTEVHKVFNVPLSTFLKADSYHAEEAKLPSGAKITLSHFDIPAVKKRVGDPPKDRIWGLTANILIDCARLVFDREPTFHFDRGDKTINPDPEKMGNVSILESLVKRGILQSPAPSRRRTKSSR